MNTKHTIINALHTSTRRRSIGLGLTALTVLGLLGCDPATGDDMDSLEVTDSDGEDTASLAEGAEDELAATPDSANAPKTLNLSAAALGSDIELIENVDTNWPVGPTEREIEVYADGQLVQVVEVTQGTTVNWIGTPGADILDASNISQDVIANGGDGADTISTGSGHDEIDGGDGNDDIHAGAGHDTIEGGNGNDTISGGSGDDDIHGGGGNDTINGGSGEDVIQGGGGADDIDGGGDKDFLFDATMKPEADNAVDHLDGGDGTDYVVPADGDMVVSAHAMTDGLIAPSLFCRFFDQEYVTIKNLADGKYVSAANNEDEMAGVYLKTVSQVGKSEKFKVHCQNGGVRLVWYRNDYGYGTVWAGSTGDEYGTNEIPNGVFAGPNGNLWYDSGLEYLRDAMEELFLDDSWEDALDNGHGTINMPVYDGLRRRWAFTSPANEGPWRVGTPYITYDPDGELGNNNAFYVQTTTRW